MIDGVCKLDISIIVSSVEIVIVGWQGAILGDELADRIDPVESVVHVVACSAVQQWVNRLPEDCRLEVDTKYGESANRAILQLRAYLLRNRYDVLEEFERIVVLIEDRLFALIQHN